MRSNSRRISKFVLVAAAWLVPISGCSGESTLGFGLGEGGAQTVLIYGGFGNVPSNVYGQFGLGLSSETCRVFEEECEDRCLLSFPIAEDRCTSLHSCHFSCSGDKDCPLWPNARCVRFAFGAGRCVLSCAGGCPPGMACVSSATYGRVCGWVAPHFSPSCEHNCMVELARCGRGVDCCSGLRCDARTGTCQPN